MKLKLLLTHVFALFVSVSLVGCTTVRTFDKSSIRSGVTEVPAGEKAKIHLGDGSIIEGYISRADQSGITVVSGVQTQRIAYSSIEVVTFVETSAWKTSALVAMGVAIVGAITVAIYALGSGPD